ncbi:MAG: anti-sigma factor family protein [Candidatus Brocadiia bacterium]
MNCEKVIGQFSAYLDGQLTAAEREAVRSHVADCARCRDELEALSRTVYAVADLPRLRAPSDLREQVMAKLDGVTPAQARPPRWRMYWSAAAAVAFAIVIILLTRSPAPRRAEPEAAAPAGKNASTGQIAMAERGGSAGSKGADEKFLRKVSNVVPTGGTTYATGAPQLQFTPVATMSSKQIVVSAPVSSEQIVLPSANPRAAYFSAIAVAVKGGWLPADLQKRAADGTLLKFAEAEQRAHQDQALQLAFSVKQSQVPLLKNALAVAGLQAAEEKDRLAGEAQPRFKGGPARLALAPARRDMDSISNVTPAESRFGLEGGGAAANPAIAGANAPAPAAMKAPEDAAARQSAAQKKTEAAEPTTPQQTPETEEAKEPLVQVTLLFPLAESPAPAAMPAAGAATSATAE